MPLLSTLGVVTAISKLSNSRKSVATSSTNSPPTSNSTLVTGATVSRKPRMWNKKLLFCAWTLGQMRSPEKESLREVEDTWNNVALLVPYSNSSDKMPTSFQQLLMASHTTILVWQSQKSLMCNQPTTDFTVRLGITINWKTNKKSRKKGSVQLLITYSYAMKHAPKQLPSTR